MYKCSLCQYYCLGRSVIEGENCIINICAGKPVLMDEGGDCFSFEEKKKTKKIFKEVGEYYSFWSKFDEYVECFTLLEGKKEIIFI